MSIAPKLRPALDTTLRAIRACSAACLLAVGVLAPSAYASTVEFTFTLFKPLVHGAQSIGGASSPVVYRFQVDSLAPDLNSSTTDGLFSILGASVHLGAEDQAFSLGIVATHDSVQESGFTATANRGEDGSTFAGRSLFVVYANISDFSGQMFSDTALPTNDTFDDYAGFGMFRLTFRPNVTDPEFLAGDYVHFDAFPLAPGDFAVTRTEINLVPEPTAAGLMILALSLLSFQMRLRPRQHTKHGNHAAGDA